MDEAERFLILKRASWAGILGNGALAAAKIAAGLAASSLAVVGDGIDTLTDIVTSIVTLYAARVASAPPDPEHPWGHGRAETIATKTLSFIIVTAGLQLLALTARKIFGDVPTAVPGRLALAVTGISIAGKVALAAYKYRAGRKTDSAMMKADALNMRNDILLSLAVLLGVLFTRVLHRPILDVLTGMGVSVWIIVAGVRIFIETNTELMDSVENPEVYRRVFEAVHDTEGADNPHRVRIRRLNSLHVIDLDVEVDKRLSVDAAHAIACRVEKAIRSRVDDVYDIMVHVEPAGVADHEEGYGLVPGDLDAHRKIRKD